MTDQKQKREAADAEERSAAEQLQQARESLRRMEEEIAPFVKRSEYGSFSTAGRWRETSDVAGAGESRSHSH